jgi:amino acid transporter
MKKYITQILILLFIVGGVATQVSAQTTNSVTLNQPTIASTSGTVGTTTGHCVLNGQEVPCSQLVGAAKHVFEWGLGIVFLIVVLILLCGVFWLAMLVHAISKPIDNIVMWIAIVFFFVLPGALLYYFSVKRPYDKRAKELMTGQQPDGRMPPNTFA